MGEKVALVLSLYVCVCSLADKTTPEIPRELLDLTMYVKRIISLSMFALQSTARTLPNQVSPKQLSHSSVATACFCVQVKIQDRIIPLAHNRLG